jgi:tetratricopeptide (TPR) repeat protein
MLYEMLTGQLPFQGPTAAVLAQILTQDPPSPRTHRPDLEPALEAICLKAMAKKPEDRYASMAELADALVLYLKGQGEELPAGGSVVAHAAAPARLKRLATQFLARLVARLKGLAGGKRGHWLLVAALVLVGVLAVTAIVPIFRSPPRVEATVPVQLQGLKEVNDPTVVAFFLDGKPISKEDLAGKLKLRPGQHSLEVKRHDGSAATFTFPVSEADDQQVVPVQQERRRSPAVPRRIRAAPKRPAEPRLLVQGKAHLEAYEYDKAIEAFDELIEQGSAPPVAYVYRAWALFYRGHGMEALAQCRRALERDGKLALAYAVRAQIYTDQMKLDEALADASAAIRLEPTLARAWAIRGWAHARGKRLSKGLADFEQALRLGSGAAFTHCYRGVAYIEHGEFDKALADLNRSVQLEGKFAIAFMNRGIAHASKGDLDKALADLTTAIRLDANYPLSYSNRGFVYRAKGDLDRAIADLTEYIRLEPLHPEGYTKRGRFYLDKGDRERALADFNEALRHEPSYVQALNSRGIVYSQGKEWDKALADFNKALELDPECAPAYSNRGAAYGLMGNYARALDDHGKAIALNPRDPFYYENRARVYQAMHLDAAAQKDRDKARRLRAGKE